MKNKSLKNKLLILFLINFIFYLFCLFILFILSNINKTLIFNIKKVYVFFKKLL